MKIQHNILPCFNPKDCYIGEQDLCRAYKRPNGKIILPYFFIYYNPDCADINAIFLLKAYKKFGWNIRHYKKFIGEWLNGL